MLTFGNVITAMITPFHEDGSVNYEGAVKLAQYYCENGSDGILVAGTTGEGATMTEEEKLKLFTDISAAVGDKVMVMANVGTNNTAQTIEFMKKAEKTGVDCFLAIVPYYNKPNQDGCYAHFAALAKATDMPILLYNVPGRTGGKIEAATVVKLAHDFKNIVGIKEASGDMSYAMKIARCVGPDFALYSGNDDITVPILSIGGSGVISVYANVMPAMCRQIVADWLDGNHARALENHLRYLQLMNDLFLEVNPIPVKAAMNMMGLDVGPMRLPLCEMGKANAATLRRTLEEAGLL